MSLKRRKTLFYRRKINSSQKELNIQFLICCYKPNESLPIFSNILFRKNNIKIYSIDAHGYLKKCSQLFEIIKKKVVENDIHHL